MRFAQEFESSPSIREGPPPSPPLIGAVPWWQVHGKARLRGYPTPPSPRLPHWPVRFLKVIMGTMSYSSVHAQQHEQHEQHLVHSMCSVSARSSALNLHLKTWMGVVNKYWHTHTHCDYNICNNIIVRPKFDHLNMFLETIELKKLSKILLGKNPVTSKS